MINIYIKPISDSGTKKEIKHLFEHSINKTITDKLKLLGKFFITETSYIAYNGKFAYFIGQKISLFNNKNTEYFIFNLLDSKTNLSDNDFYDFNNKIVSFILYKSFFIKEYKKLSIYVCSSEVMLKDIALKHKFTIEGNISSLFDFGDFVYDANLYALSLEDFKKHGVGYYKINDKYLKIVGCNYGLFEISVDNLNSEHKTYNNIIYDSTYSKVKIAINQLDEYFKGKRNHFDLNLEIYDASDFQKEVWEKTKQIPYGELSSYEDIASKLKSIDPDKIKNYSRAVGTALSKNPILILIPCHRVIGKDGKLKGFAAGVDFKDYLLNNEMLKF